MKECYHFTKIRYLESILNNGLQPMRGPNCSLLGDKKAKVSYSVGKENAAKMFRSLFEIYLTCKEGIVSEEIFGEEHKKVIASKSFEEWEELGVYLMFDGEGIKKRNKNEAKPDDSYTKEAIPPEELKVCVIRDNRTGEVFSSKYDIVCYWSAESEQSQRSLYAMEYKEKITKFKNNEFYMDSIPLSEFCEMYLGIKGEKALTTSQIGKKTESSPSEDKKGIAKIFENWINRLLGRPNDR